MPSHLNQNRRRGISITFLEGFLFAVLLHAAVGIIYLYSSGYIDDFISRYRLGLVDGPSDPAVASRQPVVPVTYQTGAVKSVPGQSAINRHAGYQIDINVFQKDDELLVRGLVSKGAPCDMLEIRMELSSETGKKVYLWTAVEDIGGSRSRLIKKRRWVGRVPGRGFPKWSASVLSATCISN